MAKRIPKENLETDPLLTSYYIFTSFLKRNMTAVIVGSVAVLAFIGGGIGYYLHAESQEQQAQELLVYAEEALHQGNFEVALQGGEGRVDVGFIDIISSYGRTSAGNLARFYAAVAESELGNYEEALRYIEAYRPVEGILGVGPLVLHGSVLANLHRYDEASNAYEKAADWDVNDSTTPEYLLKAAQLAFEAGNNNRAKQLVERVLNDYEQSEFAEQARRLHGMILAV
ncbi:hypothetical protein QLX67_06560 [Balneolaceae bacterium ANBcel3]|nr:hypothetical protein [Balneolaceae bacterium ANBcel3]